MFNRGKGSHLGGELFFCARKKGKESIMNKAMIIGRLDKEVQFKDNFDSDPKCRFKLAVTERWKDKARTELINILAAPELTPRKWKPRVRETWFSSKDYQNRAPMRKTGKPSITMKWRAAGCRSSRTRNTPWIPNEVTLVGRLGSDPKVFKEGKVTAFSMACEDYNGKEQTTRWINIVTFDRLAQSAGDYLAKGRLVAVEGKIHTREYEKDGTTRTATSIVADRWTALDANPKTKEKAAPVSQDYAGDIPF